MSESNAFPVVMMRLEPVDRGGGRTATTVGSEGAWPSKGLPRAKLHEIYALEAADDAAAMGFAVAAVLAAGGGLPLLWVRCASDERRAGRLCAGGLFELGLSPDALLLVVADDPAARLRVAADAARCAGIGTVLVESRGRAPEIDLTATRRLQLAAERSGATVLSLRIDAAPVPSAAASRWAVAAAASRALPADAPGAPAFDVECLRMRGGPAGSRMRVEWNRETRSFDPIRDAAPLAGAGLSLAVGGAAARDAPTPLRGTG